MYWVMGDPLGFINSFPLNIQDELIKKINKSKTTISKLEENHDTGY